MQTGFDARGLGTIYVHDRATGRRSAASVMPDGSVSHLADGAFLTADGKHLFFVARDASTVALPQWLSLVELSIVANVLGRVRSASSS